jgi:hypothetical protein
MKNYVLEKPIWTEADFSRMGWHDAMLWGCWLCLIPCEYLFDLDYIFQWVHPVEGETGFSFWVAPVTMVFHSAHDIDIDISSLPGAITILDLRMDDSRETWNKQATEHHFIFDCFEGCIALWATGFHMFVRRYPVLLQGQQLSLQERNGICFDREMMNDTL